MLDTRPSGPLIQDASGVYAYGSGSVPAPAHLPLTLSLPLPLAWPLPLLLPLALTVKLPCPIPNKTYCGNLLCCAWRKAMSHMYPTCTPQEVL